MGSGPAEIAGAHVVTPQVYDDHRGTFLELFQAGRLAASVGNTLRIAQVNCSVSRQGVIRGIHFADVPPGQAKYVSCVSGAVFDVVVDVRAGSPTFGRWQGVRLDDEKRQSIYIAEGLGHALLALSPRATIVYLCSEPFDPAREHGVNPLDPQIGIAWPEGREPVMSAKDAAAPSLRQARDAGLLPDYGRCLEYYAQSSSR